MGDDLNQLFDVGELTSTQREEVLTAAQTLATAVNDVPLAQHVAAAFAHERQVRDLESTYEKTKSSKAQYAEELQTLDPAADRQLKVVFSHLKNLSEAVHSDPEIPIKAKTLLDKTFPRGLRAITGQPFPEQNRLVKDALAELTGPSAGLVADVGMTGMVEGLAILSAQYDAAIQRSPIAVAYGTLVEAQARGHQFLLEVVARVVGMNFNSEDPAQREARGQVLSVLFRALETASERRRTRIAANRRRRKKAEDSGDSGNPDNPNTPDYQD